MYKSSKMSNQIVWKILSVWHRSSCLNVTDSEDEFLFGPTIWNHEGSILSLDPFDECVMFFSVWLPGYMFAMATFYEDRLQ